MLILECLLLVDSNGNEGLVLRMSATTYVEWSTRLIFNKVLNDPVYSITFVNGYVYASMQTAGDTPS
jgi:hypothetical protein